MNDTPKEGAQQIRIVTTRAEIERRGFELKSLIERLGGRSAFGVRRLGALSVTAEAQATQLYMAEETARLNLIARITGGGA